MACLEPQVQELVLVLLQRVHQLQLVLELQEQVLLEEQEPIHLVWTQQ